MGFMSSYAANYSTLHTEARKAAPMAAVSVILVDGAPLSWTGLHLSVLQHSILVSNVTPNTVPFAVELQPAGSMHPCVLKPTELETDGKAEEKWNIKH